MTITLGQLVKTTRNAAGVTQPQACVTAGVSVGTWSRVERDRLIPEPRYVAAIASAVGVTPAQLEQCGQGDAAELLRARLGQAADSSGQRQLSPNSIVTAITGFQLAALDLGWGVSLRHPDSDVYLIELRRDRPITAVASADGR
jgi:transcriptional regulator with XRE-family HTH domain